MSEFLHFVVDNWVVILLIHSMCVIASMVLRLIDARVLMVSDLIYGIMFGEFIILGQIQDFDGVIVSLTPKKERQKAIYSGNSKVFENDLGQYWRWMFKGTDLEFNKELYAKAYKNLYDKELIKL